MSICRNAKNMWDESIQDFYFYFYFIIILLFVFLSLKFLVHVLYPINIFNIHLYLIWLERVIPRVYFIIIKQLIIIIFLVSNLSLGQQCYNKHLYRQIFVYNWNYICMIIPEEKFLSQRFTYFDVFWSKNGNCSSGILYSFMNSPAMLSHFWQHWNIQPDSNHTKHF